MSWEGDTRRADEKCKQEKQQQAGTELCQAQAKLICLGYVDFEVVFIFVVVPKQLQYSSRLDILVLVETKNHQNWTKVVKTETLTRHFQIILLNCESICYPRYTIPILKVLLKKVPK